MWQEFKEENVAKKEQEAISRQYQVEADKIVIKKESIVGKSSGIVYDSVILGGKIFLCVVDLILVSFALTVLINSQLREAVFSIIMTW